MDLTDLNARLSKGENLHTEFKAWPVQPEDLATAIVAFANTDGGQLMLGVNDDGQIAGIDEGDLDRVAQFVDNIAYQNCEPPVTVVQETLASERGHVRVVHVPKGDQRPYRTNRGIYYVRTSSGRRQASREELLRLFQSTESLYYDETCPARSRKVDLDDDALALLLEAVRNQGMDVTDILTDRLLRNWNLIREIDGESRLTFTGILFLARSPQQLLAHAYVSALRIPGTDISAEPQDQKRIAGRMVDMLHDTMRFLDIHLLRPHHIRNLEPEVRTEFPSEVLREALVNAMAHRDYTISSPVRVIVYDDRVEIRTPGRLPNTVTVESLRQGIHVLRNPTIYNILLKIGLVTDAGSGIPRMIRILRQETGREPDFKMEGNEFVVVLHRRIDT